jgi:glucose/arabinose dehydrogenase
MARQYRGRILRLQSLFPGGPPRDYAHREMQHRLGILLRHRPVPPRGWRCLLPLVLLAATAAHAQSVPDSFTVQTLAPNLQAPCALDFLPDGRVLFVEQLTAFVRVFKEGAGVQATPVLSVSGVATDGERGLLGIAVDPAFPQRPYIYVHYTVAVPHHIRIARYTLAGDLDGTGGGNLTADPASRYDLIDDIPDAAANHNGGTVRFDVDGMLYVSLGEDGVWCAAQDSTSLRGVLLRLYTGTLPPGPGSAFRAQITPFGNPFYSAADSNLRLVAALGLRNPFRFQVDPATGQLVIGDVGENVREEVDLLSPPIYYLLAPFPGVAVAGASLGADFGWPYFEGTLPGAHQNDCGPIPTGLTAPVFDYDRTAQLGGAAIISAGTSRPFPGKSRSWPTDYSGDLFASDYYSGDLRRLTYTNGAWAIAPPVPGQPAAGTWGTGFGAVSDWRLGPDGALWYCRQSVDFAANTGSLGRIAGPGLPPASVGPPTVAPLSLTLKNSPARGTARLGVIVGDGPVTLRILDPGGRTIRTLLDRVVPHVPRGTEYTVVWDGMTGDGVAARPGVYVAQLEADGRRAGLRIPFLR